MFAPVALGQDEADIAQRPVEDALYGVRSVVPADWQEVAGPRFTRGASPDDPFLVLRSAPTGVAGLWQALLPELGLSDIPEASSELVSDHFGWMLYAIDVEVPGGDVVVQLALTEAEGTGYFVLLRSDPLEADVLREQVFLPAVRAFEALEPEPTPDPATLGYDVEEAAFPGGSEGVELAGTLTLPSTPGPHPVVVLMSGTGPQDRDESLRPVTSLKPFALIADALTSAGVGVLRYDDRGVGGSTGVYGEATIVDLTSDGRAAIDYLETREDVDAGRIGVLGHSEGAIYAATLAADDPRVAYAVVMAAPAVDGVKLLIAQNEAIARSNGAPEEEVESEVTFAEEIYPAALKGDSDAVEAILRDFVGGAWDRQSAEIRAVLGERDAFVQGQVDIELPKFMSVGRRSLLASDPQADWARVTVPVLGLFGAKDVRVPL
jgi:pimeloyl-ACP methyl ester carboxylesterase